jgi:hypothetical protein
MALASRPGQPGIRWRDHTASEASTNDAAVLNGRIPLSRLPKDWLRRLQREHITDEVARMAAERIVEQIELSNIRYELGPPATAPSTSFGRMP